MWWAGAPDVDLFPFPLSPATAGCAVSWAPWGPSWASWRSRWDSSSWTRPGWEPTGHSWSSERSGPQVLSPGAWTSAPGPRGRESAGSPGEAALREGPRAEAWSRGLSQAPLPVPGGSPPTPLHLSIDLDTNGRFTFLWKNPPRVGWPWRPGSHLPLRSLELWGLQEALGAASSGGFLEERGGPRLAGPSVPTGLASGTGPGGRGQGPPQREVLGPL